MAATAHGGAGAAAAEAGPAPAWLSWPLPGCRADSLGDPFSAGTVAELARVAGPAGGAVALNLCGHTLQAAAGGRQRLVCLLESLVPPAGLRSLALRNGTLALRPGMGLLFASNEPFAMCLERVKLTRPAPIGNSAAGRRAPDCGCLAVVAFQGAVSGLMRACRVELSPAGPAGYSSRQTAVGGRGGGRAGGACRVAGRRAG
jgi:hypothetical protein